MMTNINSMRSRLTIRLEELTTKAKEIDSSLREPDNADWEERATENEDDEVLEDMGIAALEEITQIKAALERMNIGTYGQCTMCKADIDENRLEALPSAANCMDCAI